jgi:hypothetical protein
MYGDPALGELTDTDRESAAAALQDAERAWDIRAATLSGSGTDEGRQTASVLRGGPAGSDELNSAKRPAFPQALPSHDSTQWEQTLADLINGRIETVLFIEFTSDGVSLIKAVADRSGIPRQTDAGSTKWDSVAPLLDPREEIRRFQLAGGIGTLPVVNRGEFDTAVARWLHGNVPPASCARTIVLVNHRAGWLLLDRAVALLRTMYAPAAELGPASAGPGAPGKAVEHPGTARGTSTEEVVRDALRTAPLLADHTLLLARVDQGTGVVHTDDHVLFPAGSRLRHGETATAEVTVYGWPSDRAPVVLPALAGVADGAEPTLLSARQATLPAFAPTRLSFVLRGPGEVTVHQPTDRSPNDGAANGAWEDGQEIRALLKRLPRRIIRPPAVDVFVTVEMSGAQPEETAERLAFVRDVIAALARRHGSGDGLRVGVVGHYDHVVRETDYTPLPVLLVTAPPGPAQDAVASLAGWQPARREQDTVSSLEDALRKVRSATDRTSARRHRPTERTLLIVGRRPPAPSEQRSVVPACQLGVDWRTELGALQGRGVRVTVRLEESGPYTGNEAGTVQRYTADAWDTLCAGGSFRKGFDTADEVAEDLAPAWRWDGPPCRLALATPLL